MPKLTVMVSDDFYDQLQKLARDMELTVEECQLWALEGFFAEERPAMDALLEGMKDADEGRLIPHEDVMEWARSLLTSDPLPAPLAKPLSIKLAS